MYVIGEEDKDWLNDFWPVKDFSDAYNISGATVNTAAIVSEHASSDPDKTSLIILRFFIKRGEKVKKDQKYIVGLRFYSFGDMATIDLISLDLPWHRDIVHEHAVRMNWSYQLDSELKKVDAFKETYSLPIVVVGAHLKVASDDSVSFFSSSGDFTENLFGCDVNELAGQIAFILGLNKEGSKKGKEFLEGLLAFLQRNGLREDFYENVVEQYVGSSKFTGQNFAGLITMKVADRQIKENGNPIRILVEEITDGFAKKAMVIAAAQKMIQKNS